MHTRAHTSHRQKRKKGNRHNLGTHRHCRHPSKNEAQGMSKPFTTSLAKCRLDLHVYDYQQHVEANANCWRYDARTVYTQYGPQ